MIDATHGALGGARRFISTEEADRCDYEGILQYTHQLGGFTNEADKIPVHRLCQ